MSKFNYYNGNTNNNSYNYNSSADNNLNNGYDNNHMSESMQQALRNPSQTAPARLGMWADEEDDRILKVKNRNKLYVACCFCCCVEVCLQSLFIHFLFAWNL